MHEMSEGCPFSPPSTEVITFSWLLTVDPLYTVYWLLILSTLTVDPLYIHCWSAPPESTEAVTFSHESESWLLVLSTFTVDPFYIDCWPCLHWLLTLSALTVDPLYTVHWLLILYFDCQSSLHCTLTVDPLYIDCWTSLHWLLTLSTLYIDCWSSLHSLLILSTFTVDLPPRINSVDHLCGVDHWSAPGQLSIDPPMINSLDRLCSVDCWSALGRVSIDPPLQTSTFESLIYWCIGSTPNKLPCVVQVVPKLSHLYFIETHKLGLVLISHMSEDDGMYFYVPWAKTSRNP